jgi:hypothetical protein
MNISIIDATWKMLIALIFINVNKTKENNKRAADVKANKIC